MLQVGQKAPAIESVDQNGKPITLAQFLGKKIALYFYPKDDTPGCTAEACDFRDNYESLLKQGVQVIGVSIDSVKKHQKFVEKYDLPFPLISDEEKKVVQDYEVWGMKKFMGREYMGTNRVTFLINEKGIIEHIIDKVETKASTKQILDLWK